MTGDPITALIEAVAAAERPAATKAHRKAAFEAEATLRKILKALAEDASKAAGMIEVAA